MHSTLKRYMKSRADWVDAELKKLLRPRGRAAIPFLGPMPERIRRAMGYSLMAGGKRLRPVLVMAAAECCGTPGRRVLRTACALEMIHTYSLIHDDLPAMDDDDLRRGKPTNHKVFGEAIAVLAGDGLLTLAFEAAAENALKLGLRGRVSAELIRVIAAGSGARGMVGGQVADIDAAGILSRVRNGRAKPGNSRIKIAKAQKILEYIHTHKTAALITASLEAGAILAGGSAKDRRALRDYGRSIGLAFQIADDVLDRVGDKKKLGKRGSDLDNDKLTYPRLFGIEGSRRLAQRWIARAHKSLKRFGRRAKPLHELADYIISRDR
ncbi:MAG: farnesyl diphosphate synthase [Elusimicrobiota bacterium]